MESERLRGGEEFGLGFGHDADEVFDRGSGEEGLAIGGVFEQAAEDGKDLKIVAGAGFGRAEHEHHADVFAGVEGDAGIAAADGDDDFAHVIGAGVRDGKTVAEAGGVEPVPREKFVVEAVEIQNRRMCGQQLGNFVESGGALGIFHLQQNAGGIEKLRETAGHADAVGDARPKWGAAQNCWQAWSRKFTGKSKASAGARSRRREVVTSCGLRSAERCCF